MLAIFDQSAARGPPELRSKSGGGGGHGSAEELMASFKAAHPAHIAVHFDSQHALAITNEQVGRRLSIHSRLFGCCDEVYCAFVGLVENLPTLQSIYGGTRNMNEVQLCIEAYKTLRDRAPYPANKVVGDLEGAFAFILFDYREKKVFVAADAHGKVPLYWGMCQDNGCLVFSDDSSVLKAACGQNFAPFPKGCYFSTATGLRSFEHPMHELTPIPHIDSQGHLCGSNFKASANASGQRLATVGSGMKHVNSAANWIGEV